MIQLLIIEKHLLDKLFPQIKTHFQYDFSFLGRFGQSGLQRKKNPNCHKYATFEASFLCFHGQKYPSVCTEISHDLKLKKRAIFA